MPRRKRSRDEVLSTLLRGSVYLRPYKRRLITVFFLIILVSVFSLIFPTLTGWIIDLANGNRPRNMTWLFNLIIPASVKGWMAILPLIIAFGLLLLRALVFC